MKTISSALRCSLKVLVFAGLALTLSQCNVPKKKGNYSVHFDPPAKAVKNPSAVKVKLSTGAQRVYVMEGDEVLLATPCSVGTASTPTPLGTYTIYSKVANRRRAVMLTAKAMETLDADPAGARNAALHAVKFAPSLVPASVVAAKALVRLNDLRKAAKVLETAWKAEPHPEIAQAYVHLAGEMLRRDGALARPAALQGAA